MATARFKVVWDQAERAWRIAADGLVTSATWDEKGIAEAMAGHLNSGEDGPREYRWIRPNV